MKSYTNLFEKICSFENLYLASRKAEKGKRFRHDVAVFNTRRAENLLEIQRLLLTGEYPFGNFHTFKILRPKLRMISAAPYPERVIHHALINVIGPLFERKFIRDSYANQNGKGTSAALNRCTYYARRYQYVLQMDIQKYFPSIDHQILLGEISRTIRCRPTLFLIEQIINASNIQDPAFFYFPCDSLFTPFERRKGLPIGNLTSQYFANVYLNPLDHFVKETLGTPGYIRYVDDILVFSNSKKWLIDCRKRTRSFLYNWRLQLNPQKNLIYPVEEGIPFLGFRIFPSHRLLLPSGVKRARNKLRGLRKAYRKGNILWEIIDASIHAWLGHVNQGDTWGLRYQLLYRNPFRNRN